MMKITGAEITMSTEHRMSHSVEESVTGSSRFEALFTQMSSPKPDVRDAIASVLILTDTGYQFRDVSSDKKHLSHTEQEIAAQLFEALYRSITGKSLPPSSSSSLSTSVDNGLDHGEGRVQVSDAISGLGESVNVSMVVDIKQVYQEREATQFTSQGMISTADGRSLQFNLSLQMARTYEAQSISQDTRTVVFKDPLLMTFNGEGVALDNQRFEFDIDADGQSEWLHYLTNQAGWLAYDKNHDGKINDGSELFGSISGHGFQDLAAYDDDNNGFIDAADSVFTDLSLWQKTVAHDQLIALTDKQVGAIYLGTQETPFTIKNTQNETQAKVVRSGIYVTEGGDVKGIHQVDIAT